MRIWPWRWIFPINCKNYLQKILQSEPDDEHEIRNLQTSYKKKKSLSRWATSTALSVLFQKNHKFSFCLFWLSVSKFACDLFKIISQNLTMLRKFFKILATTILSVLVEDELSSLWQRSTLSKNLQIQPQKSLLCKKFSHSTLKMEISKIVSPQREEMSFAGEQLQRHSLLSI